MSTRLRLLLVMAGFMLVTPTTALADDYDDLHWGVGLKGGAGLNLLTPPEVVTGGVNPPIPAFLGAASNFGLAAEVLYGDYVGLEFDLADVAASGKGRFILASDTGAYAVDQELSSRELHMSFLVKGQLRYKYVKPFLSLGPTFVFQRSATFSVDAPTTTAIFSPEPTSYVMLTASTGATVAIKYIRIPVELRANWQGLDRHPDARAAYAYTDGDSGQFLDSLSVNANWESQIWLLIGVQYWNSVNPW